MMWPSRQAGVPLVSLLPVSPQLCARGAHAISGKTRRSSSVQAHTRRPAAALSPERRIKLSASGRRCCGRGRCRPMSPPSPCDARRRTPPLRHQRLKVATASDSTRMCVHATTSIGRSERKPRMNKTRAKYYTVYMWNCGWPTSLKE